MAEAGKVAIIAALEREVWPLVKNWPRSSKEFEGRKFEFYQHERIVLVCGGIGARCARAATEAVIRFYDPWLVLSVGIAGALQKEITVGQVLTPRVVVDVSDASRRDTGTGAGTLVSFSTVADADQKAKLSQAFGAQAVDMEAAAVARGAEAHGLRFMACKAISDANDFSMPALARFIAADGTFRSARFAIHVALRPWLWKGAVTLARGSALASRNLCRHLAAFAESRPEEPIVLSAALGS